jgi:hypothetical protein
MLSEYNFSYMTLVFFPQYPPGFIPSPIGKASKRKKTSHNMAPGGRASKRVRASEGSELQPPQSQTRTSKRLHLLATQGQNEEEIAQRSSTAVEEGNTAAVQDTTPVEEESGGAAQGSTCHDEDNVEENTEGK